MAAPVFTTGAALTQADLTYMMSTKPITLAYPSSTQSYTASAAAALALDTEVIDRFGMHSNVTNNSRIIIGLELGWYRVRGMIQWNTTATGTNFTAVIAKNGANLTPSLKAGTSRSSSPTFVSTEMFVQSTVSTDYVQVIGSSSVTVSTLGSGQGGMLSVEFLGT